MQLHLLTLFLTLCKDSLSTLLCLCYISQLQDKNRAHLAGELQSAHEASCVDFYKLLKTLAWVPFTPNSIFKHMYRWQITMIDSCNSNTDLAENERLPCNACYCLGDRLSE